LWILVLYIIDNVVMPEIGALNCYESIDADKLCGSLITNCYDVCLCDRRYQYLTVNGSGKFKKVSLNSTTLKCMPRPL